MIKTITVKKIPHQITLFFSFHFPEDYIYKIEFEKLSKTEKKFEVIATMSAKEKEFPDWNGPKGRVTAHIPAHIKKNVIYTAYICGPPAMVTDTVKQLIELGLKEENIHKEMW